MGITAAGLAVRPLEAADHHAVLELVNADRLPGQPVATAEMLGEALAGRSPVDSSWWEELAAPRTAVAATSDGEVVGVVSFSTRSRDDAGVLLWLHAREDRTTIHVLLQHVLDELREHRVVEAFSFATALGLGLEALPVRHRPVTAAALVEAGFVGTNLWRYMGRRLPADDLSRLPEVRIEAPEPDVRELTVVERDRALAQATVGVPVFGIGVLWWISSEPEARGRGYGRALLGSALQLLTELGASDVILFVDDDDPGGERDRTAANRLYDASGFIEYDRLHSYRLER